MFTGFSAETIDFLWGIRMNNDREWFAQHKEQYTNYVYRPMKELGAQLFQPFLDTPGNLLKVSRIYRDARLHHPLPYKETLWLCIRKDVEWWAENPCLFLELRPEGVEYGLLWWKPRPAMLERLRQTEPEKLLRLVEQAEAATGLPVLAQTYKKPKPAPKPELERVFAWKSGIVCTRTEEVGEAMFSPELADRAGKLFHELTPLYEFLCKYAVE